MTRPERLHYEGAEDRRDTPPFVFYARFYDDWERFSRKERRVIAEFLEILQDKYGDPEFQKMWEKRDKYWAARLAAIEFRVFWTVVYSPPVSVIFQRAKEIHILAVEPIPGR